MTKPAQDQTVLLLIEKVKEKKSQIQKVENPSWKTNCVFTLGGDKINIRTLQTVSELVSIASAVRARETSWKEVIEELGVKEDCVVCDYSPNDWMSDIKTRVNKININMDKRNLAKLEERLDKIISPELRAKMELEAIEKELED